MLDNNWFDNPGSDNRDDLEPFNRLEYRNSYLSYRWNFQYIATYCDTHQSKPYYKVSRKVSKVVLSDSKK